MTYTLVTGLAWFVLAFAAGAAISAAVVLTARRRPDAPPVAAEAADDGDAELLPGLRRDLATSQARVAELERERAKLDGEHAQLLLAHERELERKRAGLDEERAREAAARQRELEHVTAERDRLRRELEALHHGGSVVARLAAPPPVADAPPPDTAEATDVVGHHVVADDLTEIVGIEEHTALLCHWIGIHTWRDLAATPVEQLRTMLDDAGSRFAHLDPTTWPEQASLLSQGRWAEFAALTARLAPGGERPGVT